MGRALECISDAISRIVSFNTQIASAGEEQTIVVSEVERILRTISAVNSQTDSSGYAGNGIGVFHQTREVFFRVSLAS